MSYMTAIRGLELSSKEKAMVHDRGRNFDLNFTKLGTHVGLIKIKIGFIDEGNKLKI